MTQAGEQIAAFLEAARAGRGAADNTVRAYARDLTDFAAWMAARGGRPQDATRAEIEGYLAGIEAAGMARATRARRLAAIRQFIRFAHEEGWRPDNPTLQIRGPRPDRQLPRTLSEDEVTRLLDAARQTGRPALRTRNTCLMELLYATGMRVSELVALPVAAARGDPRMLLVRGKGGRERDGAAVATRPHRADRLACLARRRRCRGPARRRAGLGLSVPVARAVGPPDAAPLLWPGP
jgi:integrase/recombinase XerD